MDQPSNPLQHSFQSAFYPQLFTGVGRFTWSKWLIHSVTPTRTAMKTVALPLNLTSVLTGSTTRHRNKQWQREDG